MSKIIHNDYPEILSLVIQLMKRAELLGTMSGQEKKDFVLKRLEMTKFIEPDTVKLISHTIDLIIELDKNKIKIRDKINSCCIIF